VCSATLVGGKADTGSFQMGVRIGRAPEAMDYRNSGWRRSANSVGLPKSGVVGLGGESAVAPLYYPPHYPLSAYQSGWSVSFIPMRP
jgi:hypothetical protein